MIYIVLGMHKCGTTLVSQMLEANGVSMIDYIPLPDDLEYKYGGQYEDITPKKINEALLGSRGLPSARIKKVSLVNADRLKSTAEQYVGSKAHLDTWGFKDPRTSLTYQDFWRQVLSNIPHKPLIVYRTFEEFISRTSWYNIFQKIRMCKRYIEHYDECKKIKEELGTGALVLDYKDTVANPMGTLKTVLVSDEKLNVDFINSKLVRVPKLNFADRLVSFVFRTELRTLKEFYSKNRI